MEALVGHGFIIALISLLLLLCLDSIYCRVHYQDAKNVKHWSIQRNINLTNDVAIELMFNQAKQVYQLSIQILDPDKQCLDDKSILNSITNTSDFYQHAIKYGPDEIIVFIEGKTLQSFIPRYRGCHLYEYRFSVDISGIYHLKIVRTRQFYTALNESYLDYPYMSKQYLLNEWLELNQSSHHDVNSCHGYWVLKTLIDSKSYQWMNITTKYDSFNSIDKNPLYYNESEVRGLDFQIYNTVGNLTYLDCSLENDFYTWIYSDDMCHKRLSVTQEFVNRALKDKVYISFGDSHSRRVVSTLLELYCGVKSIMSWEWMEGQNPYIISPQAKLCPGFRVYMFDQMNQCNFKDMFLRNINFTENTFFSLNCGHHPASHYHVAMHQYQDMVNSSIHLVTKMFQDRNLSMNQFVWLESTAFPLVNYIGVATHQDWRTQHRLSMFNDIANDIMFSLKLNVVRTFQIVLPFIEFSTCDPYHFPVTVMAPVAENIIRHMSFMSENS